MRPTTLFIVFAVGALGFLAYVGKQAGVKAPALPKLEIPNIQMPAAMISLMKDDEPQENGNVTAYKWQDANGQWHYGNTPPTGIKAEALSINTNQNVLLSPKLSQPDNSQINSDASEPSSTEQDIETLPSTMPVPYQEVQKMLGLQPTQPQPREIPR